MFVHQITNSTLYRLPVPGYNCPSDPNAPGNADTTGRAQGSYVGCHGNVATTTGSGNGIFSRNSDTKMRDILDGASNTLMIGEVISRGVTTGTSPSATYWGCPGCYGIGGAHGEATFTTREVPNTTVADQNYLCKSTTFPNAPCVTNTSTRYNFARSYHVGGVQVTMGDGSVRFISSNVNLTTYQNLGNKADGTVLGEF